MILKFLCQSYLSFCIENNFTSLLFKMDFQRHSISLSIVLVFFVFIGGVVPTEGLKCISCTFAPGISGNKDGCNVQNVMAEKFMRDCSNVTASVATEATTVRLVENGDTVPKSDLIGKMYCYTFTSQLNGKWLTERGCGASKVTENLHNTCENVTDKNSSSLSLKDAKICYCNDFDGCNNEISIRNTTELSNSQNSTFSVNRNGTNADRQNNRTSTRNIFNSLTYHTRIQIVPNYQNPFDKLRRRNNTDNVTGQSYINGSTIPNIGSTNASTNTTISSNNATLLANQLKVVSNATINENSNDKIVQNKTIGRNANPISNETAFTEKVKDTEASIASTLTPEHELQKTSLNNNSTIPVQIFTNATDNATEKGSTEKNCDTQSGEKSGVNLLRPHLTSIDAFVFISIIVVAFSM